MVVSGGRKLFVVAIALALAAIVAPVFGTAPPARSLAQGQNEQPAPYAFFPQAGVLWKDLYVANFVDLDPSNRVSDWNCTNYSYDGHSGHDVAILGFKAQAIGVPVFAALDGRVVDLRDGEPDTNTGESESPGNFIVLQHQGSHQTIYHHLKTRSLRVRVDDVVRAGTQIAETGSSGNSTWPHLHFESQIGGKPYEPSAGPCRSGPSYWVHQEPLPASPVVGELIFSEQPMTGRAALPWDEVKRTGTVVKKTGTFYVRVQMGMVPPNASYELEVVAPDGTATTVGNGTLDHTEMLRQGWFWWGLAPPLVPGEWKLRMFVNGERLIQAPFKVVRKKSAIKNRAPKPLQLNVHSTGNSRDDVLECRVVKPVPLRDPDYDFVSYRYVWTVDGMVVRTTTSAALSDMLAAGSAGPTSAVTCKVTPSDGKKSGPTAQASLT